MRLLDVLLEGAGEEKTVEEKAEGVSEAEASERGGDRISPSAEGPAEAAPDPQVPPVP